MENTGGFPFIRNRRLESFFNTNPILEVIGTPKFSVKAQVQKRPPKTDGYVDDDSWITGLISFVRIVLCFTSMMVPTFIWARIMVLLIPWPYGRIRQGNIYGHVTDRMLMWILGNPVKTEGTEFWNEKAIYICNHASPIDIFLIMWLTPTGTVGIAKTEGFAHLALQTRLPIVPIVLTGTHLARRKGSLRVRPAPISVKFLRPIRTDGWKADTIDEHIKSIHDTYMESLPESQRPQHL